MTADEVRFAEARSRVLGEETSGGGIGTLSEKVLHRILKLYIEPDESYHEVACCGAVADILRDGRVTEVQTRSLSRLVPKLRKYLPAFPVTVVYPLPYRKTLRWIDPVSGTITPPRKSPKTGSVFDALYELYNIRQFFSDPAFTLKLMFLDVEDYRYLDGYGRERKCRSTRMERIPCGIVSEITFTTPADYRVFLPDGLPDPFTAADYNRAVGGRFHYAYSGIRILQEVGLLPPGERRGRSVLYPLP